MINPVRAAYDFLRGEDLKVRVPSAPAEPPTLAQAAAEQKMWLWNHPGSLFTSAMYGVEGPLVHGPLAWKLYGGVMGYPPIASNSAVFACLAVIAKAHQEAPLRVFRTTSEGKDEWVTDHPFQALVDDPHPSLTPVELNWWVQVAKHVTGNAYLRKIRAAAGNVVELWPLSPTRTRPHTTDADRRRGVFISHYRHEVEPSKYEDIPVEDIVHFRMGLDDRDHRLGCSPLQMVIREVCTDDEAHAFTDALLRNMGAVGLVVTTPQGVPLTEEQATALRERIDATFSKEGRGRTSVLTHGATMAQMGFDPQRMDLKTVHRVPEERIAAVLGVHPMVAGLGAGLDRSTFSNFEEAREGLFEQTIMPLYTADAATWQKRLLRADFDTNASVHCKYDTTNVRALLDDLNEVYKRLSLAVGGKPFLFRNEARSEVGFDPVDGWDEEDQQSALEAAQDMAALAAPEDEEAPAEQRRRRLVGERKAIGLGAFPGLMDAVQELAQPALEKELAAYFTGQAERVRKRLGRG